MYQCETNSITTSKWDQPRLEKSQLIVGKSHRKIWQRSWISHPGHLPPNQLCQALAVLNHEIRCDGDWVSRPFIFHVHNVATCIGFRFSGKTVIGIDALLWVRLPLGYSAIHFFCRVVEFWSRAMSIWNLSVVCGGFPVKFQWYDSQII